jgi:hypothetical protein
MREAARSPCPLRRPRAGSTSVWPSFWGGFIAGLYSVGLAHLGANFRGGELAAANAAFSTLYAVGTLTGQGLGGIAMDLWNQHGLSVVVGLISAVFIAVVAYRAVTFPRAPTPTQTA